MPRGSGRPGGRSCTCPRACILTPEDKEPGSAAVGAPLVCPCMAASGRSSSSRIIGEAGVSSKQHSVVAPSPAHTRRARSQGGVLCWEFAFHCLGLGELGSYGWRWSHRAAGGYCRGFRAAAVYQPVRRYFCILESGGHWSPACPSPQLGHLPSRPTLLSTRRLAVACAQHSDGSPSASFSGPPEPPWAASQTCRCPLLPGVPLCCPGLGTTLCLQVWVRVVS